MGADCSACEFLSILLEIFFLFFLWWEEVFHVVICTTTRFLFQFAGSGCDFFGP